MLLQGTDNDSKKRRVTGVAVLNSTLKQNGCRDRRDGIINYRTESEKWTLPELVRLIESQGYTGTDV